MVVFTVHTKCLKHRYLTTLCSTTTLFVIIIAVICIVFPFIVAYRSRGFWLKHDSFYEQPHVSYRYEFLFIAATDDKPLICNNLIRNSHLQLLDSCSVVKAREIDSNDDGIVDELYFKLTVNLPNYTVNIKSITAILTFNYQLHDLCPLYMQTAAIYQITNILSKTITLFGELTTFQSFPLLCYGIGKDLSHNVSILHGYSDAGNGLHQIIENYSKRNITTHIKNLYTTWLADNEDEFTLNIRLKISEQLIYYKPSFWQIIKWAWIQYFAVFIIFLGIFNYIKNYVFDNHLVLFYKISAIKQKIN